MKPKDKVESPDLFRSRLDQILNPKHPLFLLAGRIDWQGIEEEFADLYDPRLGRPGVSIRLLVGLHYLKHAFGYGDETVVAAFLENPYWQYFCGLEYFVHELPLEPTTLVKWRKRVGAERMERLLELTIRAAEFDRHEMRRVNLDTTVQEKAIAFPTDARLYYKARERLVSLACRSGVKLRQSYVRLGRKALVMSGRYARASQFKRARKATRQLKRYLGCVVRDLGRKVGEPDAALREELTKAQRLLAQRRDSKGKLYSLHAPEVECIAKGKAHKRYEFGCKVSVVSTSKNGWIVGTQALHGAPYDGHTLGGALEQVQRLTGTKAEHVYADRGYRGHGHEGEEQIHIAGMGKRKKSRWERMWRRRRNAVEAVIGALKREHRMDKNWLLGREGDRINAILAASGYNLRKLLRQVVFVPVGYLIGMILRGCHRAIDPTVLKISTAIALDLS